MIGGEDVEEYDWIRGKEREGRSDTTIRLLLYLARGTLSIYD